jgi:hypothetical protein
MIKPGFKVLFVSTLILTLLLGAAFHQREPLLRLGANRLLAPHQFTVTALQGLQVNASRLAIAELELAGHALGLHIVITEVQLAYGMSSYFSAPTLEVLQIGSARILRDPTLLADTAASAKEDLQVGDMLQLLRNLPLGALVINELSLPDQDGSFDVELESSSNEILARINSNTLQLTASFSQTAAELPALLQAKIETAASSPFEFMLTLTPTALGHQLNANGLVDIPDVQTFIQTHFSNSLTLPVEAATLNWDMTAFMTDDFSATLSLPHTLGINPGSKVTIPANLRPDLGAITFDFSERAEFTITGFAEQTYSISLVEGFRLSGELEQSKVGEYHLNTGFLLKLLQLDMGATLSGALRIETQQLEVQGPRPWLPQFDLVADLDFTPELLTYNTQILLRDAPSTLALVSQGQYQLNSGAGQFAFNLPATQFMGGEGRSLAAYLDGWPYSFNLMTGSLAAQLELSWQPGPVVQGLVDAPPVPGVLTGSIDMQLVDGAGYYGEFFFRGLDLPLKAVVDSTAALPLSTPPLRLTATGLDVGLVMENLVLDFQIDGSQQLLNMPSIQVEALGGSFFGEALVYDFSRDRNQLTLQFSGLRLENMLSLTEYKGVSASGAVTGELPITITATGVEVDAGILRADHPGGSIMYLDAVIDGGNAGINLVNQALSNYQFESLESTIDYSPDGELLLSMKLQGHNPNMQGGQRINLNLNLSNNIPQLLESLQARRAIEDFLEEKYR